MDTLNYGWIRDDGQSTAVGTVERTSATVPHVAAVVPGTADIWLAGQPDGTELQSYNPSWPPDVAPANSPVESTQAVWSGSILTFTVQGGVNHHPGQPFYPPDGDVDIWYAEGHFGLSGINAPLSSLVGAFLEPHAPDPSLQPESLDFQDAAQRDFATLAPRLQQVFFIGDGRRSTGEYQYFTVPQGATRLFLGAMDAPGTNFNNGGEILVNVALVAPLLDLPFPHASNEDGLDRIYSFFDHEYPLLPTAIGGSEPQGSDTGSTILPFIGNRRSGTLYQCVGGYSCYSGHNGHDFSYNLPEGTPVLAAAAGEVSSGTDFCGSHYVKINHGRYQTVYWHLRNDAHWRRSGHVDAGERIGSIGNSGAPRCSRGPHLHFGVYYDCDSDGVFEIDETVDPYGFDPTKTDPWTLTFTDAKGQQHKGALSTWLWGFSPPAQTDLWPGTERFLTTGNVSVSTSGNAVSNPALVALMLVPEPSAGHSGGTGASLGWLTATASTIATDCTFQLSAVYADGVPLTTFATPVIITVTYTDSDLTYVNETTLSLHQWEEASASWIPLTTALDISANQVMATTDEPGLFSLRAQPINPAPVLLAVFPSSTTNSAETRIVVTGTNFLPTPWLNFGIAALDVHYLSSSTLTATVPPLLAPGTYTLTLRNPDGQIATLPNAFTVPFSLYLPIVVKDN